MRDEDMADAYDLQTVALRYDARMGTCTAVISGNELYDDRMVAGEQAIERGDYAAATAYFYRAHAIGHDDQRLHSRAHRAIERAGWLRRAPRQAVTHVLLSVLTWAF